MEKIIVGVGEHAAARDALRLAAELADREGCEVISVASFAYDPAHYVYDPGSTPWSDVDIEHEYLRKAAAAAEAALKGRRHRHIAVRDTPAARALNDLAEEEAADLIVIGSTHRGPIGQVFPGSVGERLLNGAPCGVAVAPRGYASGAHPGLGLIGVAYDGSPEAELALTEAIGLAGGLDAELRVITVAPGLSSDIERYRALHDRALDSIPREIDAVGELDSGDAGASLARHGVDLDLLVVGSRAYGPLRRVLLGSTSAFLMRTAPCPVLVMPRGAEPEHAEASIAESAATP